MSPEQRQLFREHPNTLYADSTHKTNRAGLLLASFKVLNHQGAGVPVMQAFIKSESEYNLSYMFRRLKLLEPEACSKIKTVTTDLNNAFKNAFKKEIETDVLFIKCAWHIDQAWAKNAPRHSDMLAEWKALRLETVEENFHSLYHCLQEFYRKHGTPSQQAGWEYFVSNYGYNGSKTNPQEWSRCFNAGAVPHNIFIERYHREIKSHWFYPYFRVDQCLDGLEKYNLHVSYQEIGKLAQMRNIRPSQAQKRFKDSHTLPIGFTLTALHHGGFILQDVENEEDFILSLNDLHQCNLSKCLVTCENCPGGSNLNCAHAYRCTCRTYAEENQCKHLHMRNILENGGDTDATIAPSAPSAESSSQQRRTQFPVTTLRRAHSPMRQQFAAKPKRRKTGKAGRHGKYADWSLDKLLKKMLDENIDIDDFGWGFIICYDKKVFERSIAKLGNQQQLAREKYEEAKLNWTCSGCSEHTFEKAKSQYISCTQCEDWYHGLCSGMDLQGLDVENITWNCQKCVLRVMTD
jgi:hypothetical protein